MCKELEPNDDVLGECLSLFFSNHSLMSSGLGWTAGIARLGN